MSSPVYEVNKEIDVSSMMQLIDINGSMKNFQTEFTVKVNDPSKTVFVAIVNQEQLDNGEIHFDPTESGLYSKRVTYQGEHLNHFIALKKQAGGDEEDIKCSVMIRLKELEPPKEEIVKDEKHVNFKTPIEDVLNPRSREIKDDTSRLTPFQDELQPETRTILKNKLSNLRQSPEYYQASTQNEYKGKQGKDGKEEKKEYPKLSFSERLQADPYYLVGMISMILFLCIIAVKFMKK
jgi:hypothetical protein